MKSKRTLLLSLLVSVLLVLALAPVNKPSQAAGPQPNKSSIQIEKKAMAYLRRYVAQQGNPRIGTPVVAKVEADELGMWHVFIQQWFNDVRMWTGEAIAHLNSDESLFTITDNLITNVEVDTTPNFSARGARDLALAYSPSHKQLRADPLTESEPLTDLWVFRGQQGDRLT